MGADPLSLDRSASAAEGELRLPTPPGVIRRFWARHPWLTDSLIAGCYFVFAVPFTFLLLAVSPGLAVIVSTACAFLTTAAVLFRRHVPVTALAVAIVCLLLSSQIQVGFSLLATCVVLYSVAVFRSNRAAWIGLLCACAASVIGGLLPFHPTPYATNGNWVVTSVFLLLPSVLVGVNVGNRRRYLDALLDRAAQLARERDQQARLAAAAERARIAREMHDIVSHSLTVMVGLADGSSSVAEKDPARAREAMQQVAETGRHALADMRRMLGLLAETDDGDDAGLAPQPSSADLTDLVERFRAAGLPLRFGVSGVPTPDPTLQLTVYRVVQEALTNVLRHAPDAAAVSARIDYGPGEVVVRVEDSGGPASASRGTAGAGRGLVGMRERVALYGGTLVSGPLAAGGWRVEARMRTHENREQS